MSATGDDNGTVQATRNREEIDWSRREPVSMAIQQALDHVEDRPATDMAPLADYVDPDALEAFFTGDPDELATRSVTFEYEDQTVHVDGAGYVLID
ncbi:MAG: HalOD1 output domain-containing protein [Haloplanus sp.]